MSSGPKLAESNIVEFNVAEDDDEEGQDQSLKKI